MQSRLFPSAPPPRPELEMNRRSSTSLSQTVQDDHSIVFVSAGDEAEEKEGKKAVVKLEEQDMPRGFKLWAIMGVLLLTEVLVGLDQTIVATATATVADEYGTLQDVGWYGSAYLLTSCSLMPLAGRGYAYFSQKWTFLFSFIVFELGSVISAVAQSSSVFIIGRALQGAGYAGVFIDAPAESHLGARGVLSISASTLPLRLQPLMASLMGASYGAGAVLGPLIGGAITSSHLGWRWCFWINLPPGAVAGFVIIMWCNPPLLKQTLTIRQRIIRMDWTGAALILSACVCLLIALQEGGMITPWKSAKIIGLLVGFVLLLVAFFVLQVWLGDSGSISTRLFRNRSIAFTALENFCCGATYYSILYYVPIYFQTVLGSSPVVSGVQCIATIIAYMVASTISGALVSRFGTFHWEMLFGAAATCIAAGLFATMDQMTSRPEWIGYQILGGSGMGALYMLGFVASQILLPEVDRARGSAVVVFAQLLGATIWVSASESIYQTSFAAGLHAIAGLDAEAVLASGVTGFRNSPAVSAEMLPLVVQVSVDSLFKVFVGIAGVGVVGTLAIFGIQWKGMEKEE